MTLMRRVLALLALSAAIGSLTACGGGGGSSSSSSSSGSSTAATMPDLSTSASNVVAVTVDGTTGSANAENANIPYVTVKVCVPGSTTECSTIDHVLVDTGSYGLRLFASTLSYALPSESDPNNSGNVFAECGTFADGYTWGAMQLANVQVGSETASSVPVQVIDDNGSFAAAPSACASQGESNSLNSTEAFGANGVLGVGLFKQDCGSACNTLDYYNDGYGHWYYTCNTGNQNCTDSLVTVADQVTNPVSLFATDNNGVILQFPAISASGTSSVTGYLAFGIGTESNNALDDAKPLTTDDYGNIITTFDGQTLDESFIDSGSNTFAFTDSSIAACTETGETDFYCPSSTLSLSATNQGQNGTTSQVDFSVANAQTLFSGSGWAFDNVAATLSGTSLTGGSFDWGLPFFFGRTVYFAIENDSAGGTTGPYFAY